MSNLVEVLGLINMAMSTATRFSHLATELSRVAETRAKSGADVTDAELAFARTRVERALNDLDAEIARRRGDA